MFNQFLYGEVTGIQVGHWLYDAPDLEAAKFLARQSLEEMQHVDNFLRIMTMLGLPAQARAPGGPVPGDRHDGRLVGRARRARDGAGRRLRAPGVLRGDRHARSQAERRHPPARREAGRAPRRVRRAADDEGDRGPAVAAPPPARALARLDVGRAPARRLHREEAAGRPRRAASTCRRSSRTRTAAPRLRLRRIGVLDRPLAEISGAKRAALVAEAYGGKLLGGLGSLLALPLKLLPWFKQQARDRHLPRRPARHGLSAAGAANRARRNPRRTIAVIAGDAESPRRSRGSRSRAQSRTRGSRARSR